MADTYTLIEKITVGAAGASDVTFTSIPQTYTDLVIKFSTRDSNNSTSENLRITFNNTGGTSYSERLLYGSGSAAQSYSASSAAYINYQYSTGAVATSSTFSNGEVYIPNYTSSNNKSISVDSVIENNATATAMGLNAALFSSSAAISSIKLASPSGTFVQYSTFYLYGIAKDGVNPAPSSAPYATGGDSIVFDGTYWIHTFTSSGTFTPKKNLTCDYLVVAGGGSGGTNLGGGGGAGGMRCTVTATGGGGSLESALSLTANTGYTVTIGAGGAAAAAGNNIGNSGSNSVFSTITSTGGGGGGNRNTSSGNGVSPSGGGGYPGTGAVGTANQSYGGGNSYTAGGALGAGGGGGTGQAGSNGTSSTGGKGGDGTATSITGSSVTYGGGGGGGADTTAAGAGGTGGGGAGSVGAGNATNGTANTGGGGGGLGANTVVSGAGGSGIVIVRYAA